MGGAIPLAILPNGNQKVWDLDGANYVNGATQGGTVTKNGPVLDWGFWQVWTGKSGEAGIAVETAFRDSSRIYWNRGITGQTYQAGMTACRPTVFAPAAAWRLLRPSGVLPFVG